MAREHLTQPPSDFVILALPTAIHGDWRDDDLKVRGDAALEEFSMILKYQLESEAGVLVADEFSIQPFEIPPAAQGWAELFDLTAQVRPLIDDSMRAAFVGAAVLTALSRFRAAWRRLFPGGDPPVILSESLVRAVCEARVRSEYQVTGTIRVESFVLNSPWYPTPVNPGKDPSARYVIWLRSEDGIIYQFITELDAKVIAHHIIDPHETGVRQAQLTEGELVRRVQGIKQGLDQHLPKPIAALLNECKSLAQEMAMPEDERWIALELENSWGDVEARTTIQRYEHGTVVRLREPSEPVYRIVTGTSDTIDVNIADAVVDSSAGHRYIVEFYLGHDIMEIDDLVRADLAENRIDTSYIELSINAPKLSELEHLDTMTVTVPMRELSAIVDGLMERVREFLDRAEEKAVFRESGEL